MSRQMNLPQIQKILQEFERESSQMDMKEEMMSDSIDDAMEDDGETEEEEGDKILDEVLAEIGISVSQQLRSLSRLRSFLFLSFFSARGGRSRADESGLTARRGSDFGTSDLRRRTRPPDRRRRRASLLRSRWQCGWWRSRRASSAT